MGAPGPGSVVAGSRFEVLQGSRVRLEPFDAAAHEVLLYESLHDAEGDPHLWDYLPYGPFERREWHDWFTASAASDDPLFFALTVEGIPVGQASYLRIEPDHGVIEIGHIALGPAI